MIEEVNGDLFLCDQKYSLAHCVSEDLHMGKGIAVHFKRKYKNVDYLKSQNKKTGQIAILPINNDKFIYYLITKQKYYHYPTYNSIRNSLIEMRNHATQHRITTIAIPRIGSGLDKLNWNTVKEIIKEIFLPEFKIKIIVYKL